jgi:hypothetical protein
MFCMLDLGGKGVEKMALLLTVYYPFPCAIPPPHPPQECGPDRHTHAAPGAGWSLRNIPERGVGVGWFYFLYRG